MKNPPRADRDLGAGQGRQRGERTGTGTAEDVGTWRGAQGRAVEAGGWWVRETPRWVALRTRRGGGEREKRESFSDERLWMGRR